MSFLLRKVEDVTTISKSQSLTSVSIKDCTLRVANKTTTLFFYEQESEQSSLHMRLISNKLSDSSMINSLLQTFTARTIYAETPRGHFVTGH